ncbi:MAG: hypothetical protein IPI23_10175 [Bacteroidetes bacterium]|nr:hypothetical protein [Bacteroidota bacterium]
MAINKSAGTVTANTTLSVDDSLIFNQGNLITTANLLTMKNGLQLNKRMSGFNGGYTFGSISSLDSLNSFGYFTIGQNKLVVSNCILPINSNCQIELVCNGGFEQGLQNSNLTLSFIF